jgi:hypothetical protein
MCNRVQVILEKWISTGSGKEAAGYIGLGSNGKSSIVQERLYSFFFALFQNKTNLRFFRFSSSSQ